MTNFLSLVVKNVGNEEAATPEWPLCMHGALRDNLCFHAYDIKNLQLHPDNTDVRLQITSM